MLPARRCTAARPAAPPLVAPDHPEDPVKPLRCRIGLHQWHNFPVMGWLCNRCGKKPATAPTWRTP